MKPRTLVSFLLAHSRPPLVNIENVAAHRKRGRSVPPKFKAPDGKTVKTSFTLLSERVLADYDLDRVASITTIPKEQIERISMEIGITARDESITLPIEWTDAWGVQHKTVTGNPVSLHAMRGLAAHSNGFQTIRAYSVLAMLLGIIDRPGGFRHKPPYPRPIPPCPKPIDDPALIKPNTPLPNPELGFLQNRKTF